MEPSETVALSMLERLRLLLGNREALAVLACLGEAGAANATALSERTGVKCSSVVRSLEFLQALGLVEQSSD